MNDERESAATEGALMSIENQNQITVEIEGCVAATGYVAKWSTTPPTSLGDWWWWDGDEDHRPVVLDVHIVMDGIYYAQGNHGYDESMDVTLLDGWWHPLLAPQLPHTVY